MSDTGEGGVLRGWDFVPVEKNLFFSPLNRKFICIADCTFPGFPPETCMCAYVGTELVYVDERHRDFIYFASCKLISCS